MGFILTYIRLKTVVQQLICMFKRSKTKPDATCHVLLLSGLCTNTLLFFTQYSLISFIDLLRAKGILLSLPQI